MKRCENGQALVDFLLLLVILIGIPLCLLFRYDACLRSFSARAVRSAGMMIRSWRGGSRCPAEQCKAAPAAEKKPEAPAAAPAVEAEVKTQAAAPAAEAKPAAPAAPAK